MLRYTRDQSVTIAGKQRREREKNLSSPDTVERPIASSFRYQDTQAHSQGLHMCTDQFETGVGVTPQ